MNDAIAGTAAAVAGVTTAHPFDLIKTRMQVDAGASSAPGAWPQLRAAVSHASDVLRLNIGRGIVELGKGRI
mgnify:CR=1 FL=1